MKNKGRFKKGNSMGKGRPRLSTDQKAFRQATRGQLIDAFAKWSTLNVRDLKKMSLSEYVTGLDRAMISFFLSDKMDFFVTFRIFDWVCKRAD
jgi:hypothetical protein